ncbi:MAG: response regulator [Myxococcales bacterium]
MLSLYQRIKDWQRSPDSEGTGRLARLRDGIAAAPLAWADRAGRQSDFRAAFADSPFANFIADPSGQVLVCNPRFTQLCGQAAGAESTLDLQTSWVGSWTWKAVLDDLEQAETPRFRKLTLAVRDNKRGPQTLEVLATVWLERSSDGRVARVHGSLLDPHARGELEALSGHSRQLERVTKLAGELAHDFNNLLTIILSVGELMLVSGELSAGLTRRSRALISASQRAATLATQLLNLSRTTAGPHLSVPTHSFVQESLVLARRLIPELEMRTQIAADTGALEADTAQLSQVLVNLIIHVRDSLPPDGAVGLCSQRATLSESLATGLAPGEYVQISIGAASDLERSLADSESNPQPSAAADVGRTSGLGLTSAHGIVRAAGGYIGVGRGLGNTPLFTLYLPLSQADRDSAEQTAESDRGNTILVAEDEHLVRQLTCALLREEGYQVLEASDGANALNLASRHHGPIDLLLTDVTMPQMGGVELGRELQKRFPGLAVLYMSGHSEDALLRQGLPKREAHLLAKPFSRTALTNAVRRMLQQAKVQEA